MENLKSKVAYLRGLAEGSGINESTDQGRMFKGILEVLGVMADAIDQLHKNQEDMEAFMDCIDEDLAKLEEDYLDEDEGIMEIECPNCGEFVEYPEDAVDEEEETLELLCPHCGEVVCVAEEEDLDEIDDLDEKDEDD
ncbi:MAG: CD1247 N-terminal domain-containing protein [Bacillota bacterium]